MSAAPHPHETARNMLRWYLFVNFLKHLLAKWQVLMSEITSDLYV
jgi:hypothetical protein